MGVNAVTLRRACWGCANPAATPALPTVNT